MTPTETHEERPPVKKIDIEQQVFMWRVAVRNVIKKNKLKEIKTDE